MNTVAMKLRQFNLPEEIFLVSFWNSYWSYKASPTASTKAAGSVELAAYSSWTPLTKSCRVKLPSHTRLPKYGILKDYNQSSHQSYKNYTNMTHNLPMQNAQIWSNATRPMHGIRSKSRIVKLTLSSEISFRFHWFQKWDTVIQTLKLFATTKIIKLFNQS